MQSLKRINKERNKIQEKVKTTYAVFELAGEKYVQLDTYGSPSRKNPDQPSQTLQFDRESAAFFAKLLISEFDLR